MKFCAGAKRTCPFKIWRFSLPSIDMVFVIVYFDSNSHVHCMFKCSNGIFSLALYFVFFSFAHSHVHFYALDLVNQTNVLIWLRNGILFISAFIPHLLQAVKSINDTQRREEEIDFYFLFFFFF